MVKKWLLPVVLGLMAIPIACASAPTPQASTNTPQPMPSVSIPSAPSASPTSTTRSEDAAWARVIEAAKKEGSVTVYGYSFMGDLNQAMADAFSKKYGIRADIIIGPGAMFEEKIRTEQRVGNVVSDVAEWGPAFSINLLRDGLLVPLGKELPAVREDVWLVPPTMDNGGNIFRAYPAYQTPWMNTDMVKAEETPKTWADLMDQRWYGKLLNIDPRTAFNADRYMYNLIKYKIVAPDYFTKLAAQKLIVPTGVGSGAPYTALAKGEGAIIVMGSDSQGNLILKQGAHVKPLVLSGSALVTASVLSLVKNAPHPNAGKLFMDFALSQQGFELVTRMNLLGSLRKDVPDRSVLASLKPFNAIANTVDEEIEIATNVRNGVALKALGY